MMLYATPYRYSDRTATGPSIDAGVSTFAEAKQIYGTPTRESTHMLLYIDGDNSLAISTFPFIAHIGMPA